VPSTVADPAITCDVDAGATFLVIIPVFFFFFFLFIIFFLSFSARTPIAAASSSSAERRRTCRTGCALLSATSGPEARLS